MGVDGTFVAELRESLPAPHPVTVHGIERVWVPANWTQADLPVPENMPPTLAVHSLTGFADYCNANRDKLPLVDCLVHVIDEGMVALAGALTADDFPRRAVYLTAAAPKVNIQWEHFYDAESFNVALQARFAPTPERDNLLAFVASIRESTVRETVDDGVAQVVTSKAGVALVTEAKAPNPVKLAPYRTFREIEQPASLFVLRLRQGNGDRPLCALFEADGGKWKLDAMQAIAAYLKGSLPDSLVILA